MEKTDRDRLAIGLSMFPRGACGDTSLLLGAALKDQGLGTFRYVCGSNSQDGQFESHAWLHSDGIIVDITADQFNDGMPSVFVGSDPGWYSKWSEVTDLGEGDYRLCLGGYSGELEASYRMVMANVEQQ